MNTLRNVLAGLGGGGLVGAVIWIIVDALDADLLLAWVIVGATVGSLGTVGWQMSRRARSRPETGPRPAKASPAVADASGGQAAATLLFVYSGRKPLNCVYYARESVSVIGKRIHAGVLDTYGM